MILFFGPPGSGKSVQGELLVKRNNWDWLSTGELLRKSSDPKILRLQATGELISDELTNKVLSDSLSKINKSRNVVVDGYPRNPDQASWLEKYLPENGREISCVIVFKVPKDELIRRLAGRGRPEDAPNVIKKRLEIYQKNTKPILNFFRQKGIQIFEVDGVGEVKEVHERIQKTLQSCSLV